MEASSPVRTRLSEHLSKFAYNSGKNSPVKLESKLRVDRAEHGVKTEPVEPSLQPTGHPITTPPRNRSNTYPPVASPASPVSVRKRRLQPKAESDGEDSPLSDVSDMSDRSDRSSKRHQSTRLSTAKPKAKKTPRGYADPSVYAHLNLLPDQLREGLDVIFCGINPGKMSATRGHHFAHPTNKFWPGLYRGGFTDRRFTADDDHLMPDLFNFGLTNLVPRPTAEAAELSVHEMRISVPSLIEKLRMYKPKLVCFVGKGIWDKFQDIVSKASHDPKALWVPFELDVVQAVTSDKQPQTNKTEQEAITIDSLVLVNSATKVEDDVGPRVHQTPSPIVAKCPRPSKVKETFDWTQPRAYKLVHQSIPDEPESATLFWVVPSTSGLERTPREDLWRYFTMARVLSERLRANLVNLDMFREIDVEGVYKEVEKIQARATVRAKRAS